MIGKRELRDAAALRVKSKFGLLSSHFRRQGVFLLSFTQEHS